MNIYYTTSAYRSKFDETKLFASAEEARNFDQTSAAVAVGNLSYEDLRQALDGGANLERVRAAIELLQQELPLRIRLRGADEG